MTFLFLTGPFVTQQDVRSIVPSIVAHLCSGTNPVLWSVLGYRHPPPLPPP